MLSYMMLQAKDKVWSFLKDVCPCLDPIKQKSHNIGDIHRKARILNDWELGHGTKNNIDGKIFTIETMKNFTTKKLTNENMELRNTKGSCFIERVPWNTDSSDMLLKVGRSVFPAHRFLLSIESEILRTIIDSVPAACNKATVVTLNGYEADEIKMLLTFVYLPESEIDDRNILTLLKLADELMIEELVVRCEEYLLMTDSQPPLSLLKIAHKYQLPSLEESAAIQASKIPYIEDLSEFKTLTKKQQEKVRNMSRNRYRSGSLSFRDRQREFDTNSMEREMKSPELKQERKLRDVGNTSGFEGRLSFLPEVLESSTTRTTS